ncbi:MAG: 3-deoxy-D-manno-octulosonic acid transferase [Flavobacteriaceae bacterium]|nr:3-deoxy-D-manno-octulosonic acid transferase [Flavobacteriaceae bacterium]
MKFLYNFFLKLTWIHIRIISFFNKRLRVFLDGRKLTMESIKNRKRLGSNVIWFHCSSLGEYEQSIPLIHKMKRVKPNYKIAITFFSASAFSNKLENHLCDWSGYLPFEDSKKIYDLIKFINPKLMILVKNEFWPNLLEVLNKKNITTISISSRFNPQQFFFKQWATWFLKKIKTIKIFLTADKKSEVLLKKKGIASSKYVGDTRMDRALELISNNWESQIIESFTRNKKYWVAGSTWEEDYELITEYIENTKSPKIIIAPHECNQDSISFIEKKLKIPYAKYSTYSFQKDHLKKILIIDSIGYLKYLYKGALWAYVGGGMGEKGLHNILEPAIYGIPIIIGKNYKKFPEANDLIKKGYCFSVSNKNEFNMVVNNLCNKSNYKKINPKEHIISHQGATNKIFNEIKLLLEEL